MVPNRAKRPIRMVLDSNHRFKNLALLTFPINNSRCQKRCTAIYITAVDVWRNITNLLTLFAFSTLTNWKWSSEWHTISWSSCSSYRKTWSIKITSKRITPESEELNVLPFPNEKSKCFRLPHELGQCDWSKIFTMP